MKKASTRTLIGAMTFAGTVRVRLGQAGPPAPTALDDITGCVVERDVVFIVNGRDATTRRYKYAWDDAIDALCNSKGFAISAPVK